ncbi:MAG: DNA adenine methylase, partial [Planctomycetia bacterium]|nr:DNA adenine methylase [Planctomycetia bacterium]
IGCNAPPKFARLGGYAPAIETLNSLPPREDWFTRHLCPRDDAAFDIAVDRMFYTRANGLRLDAIRHQIAEWQDGGMIDAAERAALLAPLLYQACYTSNTSGLFKGFHNGWGGQTGTALYRILSTLTLRPAVFYDNGQNNIALRSDAVELAGSLGRDFSVAGRPPEIVYLDPPYNQHPYGSNYHVLNSVALWDKPPLSPSIDGRTKAAIREDWRTLRRSPFNYRQEAEAAVAALLGRIEAHYILVSYSTDGLVPLPRLVEHCLARGQTSVVTRQYKRYRVSTQRFSAKPMNVEFVLTVDTTCRHSGESADALCQRILGEEQRALENHSESNIAEDPQLSA